MCQLSGAALMLAVSTAVFSAVSARDLQGSLARDRIVLEPDQRQGLRNHCRRQKRPCTSASDGGGSRRSGRNR
jgi:hypothetical protein